MAENGVSEREFGQLEQRVSDLPSHADLREVVRDIRAALEKHESKTEKLVEQLTTTTVESAFKLQWAEIEKHLNANAPPKRDWLPYIVAVGVVILAGIREAVPIVIKLMSGGMA